MTLAEIAEKLSLEAFTANPDLSRQVLSGYASDLLSDVMANAGPGAVWLTLQTHQNVAAVASLKELSAVILTGGRRPEEATLQKADAEGVIILGSGESAFDLAGRLFSLGLRSEG